MQSTPHPLFNAPDDELETLTINSILKNHPNFILGGRLSGPVSVSADGSQLTAESFSTQYDELQTAKFDQFMDQEYTLHPYCISKRSPFNRMKVVDGVIATSSEVKYPDAFVIRMAIVPKK